MFSFKGNEGAIFSVLFLIVMIGFVIYRAVVGD